MWRKGMWDRGDIHVGVVGSPEGTQMDQPKPGLAWQGWLFCLSHTARKLIFLISESQ
jgi:hypothetical protein